ncbi:MAG TPA: hypothetical protein VNU72_09695, partial [Puia sp.]|nr:hypothetical protein [Puia sp.]
TTKGKIMNAGISSLLKKTLLFSGALFLGWAAKAQTSGSNMASDTTHRPGMYRHWRGGGRNGGHSLAKRDGFRRGQNGFRPDDGSGGRRWADRGAGIRYTPEQRKQVMAINKDYRQKSADLFKKDNITLREYKAGLVALSKEKKSKLEGLLTQQQKDERTARMSRMSENSQVRQAAFLERLKLRLSLSDDQVAKIKTGENNWRSQLKALHDNDNLLPQQKREQMMDLMTKQKEVIKSALTPEQQTKFDEMSRRRGPRGPMGPRGPRGEHRPAGGPQDAPGGTLSTSEETK